MMAWNTSEGGPCVLRPVPTSSSDSANADKMANPFCIKEVAPNGTCIIKEGRGKTCEHVKCDKNRIQRGAKLHGVEKVPTGPWQPNGTDTDHWSRHIQGWSNMFAFPWEIGLYYNFTTSRENGQRPRGCPGLDEPFGTLEKPN